MKEIEIAEEIPYDELKAAGKDILSMMKYMEDKASPKNIQHLKIAYLCCEYVAEWRQRNEDDLK